MEPKPPAPLGAVLFDLDDTLVPWNTLAHWQWAWRPRGPVLSERHFQAADRRSLHAWDRRRWAGLVGDLPPVEAATYREFLAQALHAIAGHPLPAAETEAVIDRFLRPAHEFESFPDAAACLKALADRGVQAGVITPLPADVARTMLRRVGLPESLLLLSGDESPDLLLPHAAGFRTACGRLPAKPAECLYVGDLFWSDVRAAARAGLASVLLDRPDSWPRVTGPRIRTLTQIAELPSIRAPAPNGASGPVP